MGDDTAGLASDIIRSRADVEARLATADQERVMRALCALPDWRASTWDPELVDLVCAVLGVPQAEVSAKGRTSAWLAEEERAEGVAVAPTAAFWEKANAETVRRLGEEQAKVLRLSERVTMVVDQRDDARAEVDRLRLALDALNSMAKNEPASAFAGAVIGHIGRVLYDGTPLVVSEVDRLREALAAGRLVERRLTDELDSTRAILVERTAEVERLRAVLIDPSVEDMERLRTAFDAGRKADGIRGGIRSVLAVLRVRAGVTRG